MFLFLLSAQIIALMLLGASITIFERKSKYPITAMLLCSMRVLLRLARWH